MLRLPVAPRANWKQRAAEYGFHFHTIDGEPYWDESAYYQFTLRQIEQGIETPTAELHQMCLQAVDAVIKSEELLTLFAIPNLFWDQLAESWQAKCPSLYSRLDLVYDGKNSAKFLENNADTPTSLYESGFWQWLWLEDNVKKGVLPKHADQFNSLQEKLIFKLGDIAQFYNIEQLHFSCCKDTDEDRGTVQYLQDCATAAGIPNKFVFIEDIGVSDNGLFTDDHNEIIEECFKLYPWEFMLREDFSEHLVTANVGWVEPMWKSILSNKALLPLLWQMYPNHPNLLAAYFEKDKHKIDDSSWVRKPIYSREGANVDIFKGSQSIHQSSGPYGEEGFIYQSFSALPKFADNYTLIGSWLVDDLPAGISVREDASVITQDTSRYVPHIIA